VTDLVAAPARGSALPPLRIARVPLLHPDAQLLVGEVQQEYVRRYGSPDATPLDPAMFDPPAGAFFVAYVPVDGVPGPGSPVATGAWRRRGDVLALGTTTTAEVKRMYVAPSARGLGAARAVLAHLESTAREAGAEAVVLETGLAQPEAIALYASSGYVPTAGFGLYADEPLSRCFAKRLEGEAPTEPPAWRAEVVAPDDAALAVLRRRGAAEAGARLAAGEAPAPADVVRWVVVRDEHGRGAACGGVRRDGSVADRWVEPHARDDVLGDGLGAERTLARALRLSSPG